jgi:hypothetical protein
VFARFVNALLGGLLPLLFLPSGADAADVSGGWRACAPLGAQDDTPVRVLYPSGDQETWETVWPVCADAVMVTGASSAGVVPTANLIDRAEALVDQGSGRVKPWVDSAARVTRRGVKRVQTFLKPGVEAFKASDQPGHYWVILDGPVLDKPPLMEPTSFYEKAFQWWTDQPRRPQQVWRLVTGWRLVYVPQVAASDDGHGGGGSPVMPGIRAPRTVVAEASVATQPDERAAGATGNEPEERGEALAALSIVEELRPGRSQAPTLVSHGVVRTQVTMPLYGPMGVIPTRSLLVNDTMMTHAQQVMWRMKLSVERRELQELLLRLLHATRVQVKKSLP